MKVKIYQAYLVVEEKEVKLTKSIAKQFPIMPADYRWKKGENGKPAEKPIAKLSGDTLDKPYQWLYLCRNSVAGLVWQPAFLVREDWKEAIEARGGWVDDPTEIPTIIL